MYLSLSLLVSYLDAHLISVSQYMICFYYNANLKSDLIQLDNQQRFRRSQKTHQSLVIVVYCNIS